VVSTNGRANNKKASTTALPLSGALVGRSYQPAGGGFLGMEMASFIA